jgi:phosphatidylinositol alpha-mannosyltransferase
MSIPLPANKKAIEQLLKKENFDILHVQMPYSPLLSGRVITAAPSNTAVVGTFHILPHGTLSKTGTVLLGALLRSSKRRFDGILSVSSAARVFAKTHFGVTSVVLPNVVDLAKYSKGNPIDVLKDKKNIIFLGRFVTRKGAAYLLDAYELIVAAHAGSEVPRLILCGDGPDRQKLEKRAADICKIGGDIVFTGFIKEEEKADYLASADVAVFPSTGGESFGIVLIEAMAAGAKTVLGGDNDGYKTVLGDQPFSLINPKMSQLFAERLQQMLYDEPFAQKLGSTQRQAVKQYDIEFVGPKLVTYYTKILARRRS